MHIGKQTNCCPELFVDQWKVQKIDSTKTGYMNLKDIKLEDHKLELLEEDKYLGDIISKDGKNFKNILARKAKGKGIINQISGILEDMCFGSYYFEVAFILRNSLFLSSILTNCEAWYNLTTSDIETLEQTDEMLLRRVFEAPVSTPRCLLYLDSGCKPIRFVCMARRLLFLHYILNEDEKSLISRFYRAQEANSNVNDWCKTTEKDLKYLEIMLTNDQIKMCSKEQFRSLVNSSIQEKCLKYLNTEKEKLTKVAHISFSDLKLQDYLKSSKSTSNLGKFTFLLRSRMLEIGNNFQNRFDNFCPMCENKDINDSQQHLMICPVLIKSAIVKRNVNYDELFGNCVEDQLKVAKIIEDNFKMRKQMLKSK